LSGSCPAPTERLSFEALAVAHAAEVAPFLADSALWQWIPREPLAAAEVAQRFAVISVVDRPDGERWLNWIVRRRADGQVIGQVEITAWPDGRAHLAYFVFVPFQRNGYAREACAAALACLREAHGVTSVEAAVDTRNAASCRVLDALGFTTDGVPVAADPIRGAPALDYRYALDFAKSSA
jgi:RimJ/RimL family protein N-acetyltransferase